MNSKGTCIELGFVEKAPAWKLKSKFFPSKIGGYPAWLALENVPRGCDINCRNCSNALTFLCQLYAPFTQREDAFHRMLYVFVCRNGDCNRHNDASNIRILRCQLPRDNKYYSFDPPKESPEADDNEFKRLNCDKLCRICGLQGSKTCGSCHLVNYCSKTHQAMDWKKQHRDQCKIKEVSSECATSSSFLFPEFEIDLEPEELEMKAQKSEVEIKEDYEKLLTGGAIPAYNADSDEEEDLVKMAAKETDKQFQKFRIRISKYPDQVVRYDRGGLPLWVSSEPHYTDVPNCSICGAQRQLEFQVMPQLLVYIKADTTGSSIDWGTIVVYTCNESCISDAMPYVEEVAVKQDYSPISQIMNK